MVANAGTRINTDRRPSIHQGTRNLRALLDEERNEYLDAKREAEFDGCDPAKDAGVATSGSRGVSLRSFREWDAKLRRHRVFYYDAMSERWVEQDTRPRWQQDLDEVKARLAAKGKIPRRWSA